MEKFIKLNENLINSKLLNPVELATYIQLTKYLPYGADTGEVFPSIDTLAEYVGVCRATIKTTLKRLVKKGVISVTQRDFTTSLYYVKDLSEVLKKANTEPKKDKIEYNAKDHFEKVIKKISDSHKKHTEESNQDHQTQDKQTEPKATLKINKKDDTVSMEQLKERYCFDEVAQATSKDDAETFLSIIHETVNSTRDTVRIASSNMLKNTVLGQMLDITKEELIYTIQLFKAQTQEIKNPKYYILTMLYNAKRQYQVYMLNKSRQEAQTQAQTQEPSTPSTTTAAFSGRFKTISADSTNTTLPTCDKKIDTKNRFNNFEQRTYDYDAIFRMQEREFS